MVHLFKFIWRRKDAKVWFVKHVTAPDHDKAVAKLVKHLQKNVNADLNALEVDHYFYRKEADGESKLYTMLNMVTPLTVVFNNKPWAPGKYPAYPPSNWRVVNESSSNWSIEGGSV